MTDNVNKATLTRTWWAGTDADADIHIEAYEGDIEGSFRAESLFRASGLTSYKSVQNQTNTWRGDRIGSATVKGRRSGEDLQTSRIANEKFIVTVDTVAYIRTPFDYQDDWTAPDFKSEYAAEHASAHAISFDEAHIIQLIKCAAFVPPASLAGSFHPGLSATLTGYADALAEGSSPSAANSRLTGYEVAADILVQNHKAILTEFVKRRLGMGLAQTVTLITPDAFNILLEHKKLMNVDFQGTSATNDYSQRRIAVLNGVRVIESPDFPAAGGGTHPLGDAFTTTAAEAKAQMIVFFPQKALVTVEAQPMTVKVWDDHKYFQSNLDSYQMYTVGQRRPDAVGVIFAE
jgi:hypothetical protein